MGVLPVSLFSLEAVVVLLSIFTPTHDPTYLGDTFRSLKAQNYENWEWLIVPNCKEGEQLPQLPAEIMKHPKVVCAPLIWRDYPRVGLLKRHCCDRAAGQLLVELDHDDMLVPGILQRLVEIRQKQKAGFIYSDCALFAQDENMTPRSYDERWGWETYDFRVYGKSFIATRNFDLTPRSICEVHFAPDHVRCWDREAYDCVRGHDPHMEVGDDHDLIIRTYLAGVRFQHTGTVGYLYRTHRKNTVKSHSAKIQKQQEITRDRYLYKLIDEWLRRSGHIFVDLAKDLLYDTAGNPVLGHPDSVVGCVRAYGDVLPLVPQDKIVALLNEVYRVLIPGGWFCCEFPSTEGTAAFGPQYRSYWNAHVFDYFCHKEYARKLHRNKARFQCIRRENYFPGREAARKGMIRTTVDLSALKGQRQPGRVFV